MYNTAARQALTRFIFFITIFIQENKILSISRILSEKAVDEIEKDYGLDSQP